MNDFIKPKVEQSAIEMESGQQEYLKWINEYPDVIGEFIWMFEPQEVKAKHGLPHEGAGSHSLLGIIDTVTPKGVESTGCMHRNRPSKNPNFVSNVNQRFSQEISELAELNDRFLEHVADSYPFNKQIVEQLKELVAFIALMNQTPENTSQDSLARQVMLERMTEARIGYKRNTFKPYEPQTRQFNSTFQRLDNQIDDTTPIKEQLAEESKRLIGLQIDSLIELIFKTNLTLFLANLDKELHLIPNNGQLDTAHGTTIFSKMENVTTIPFDRSQLSKYQIKIQYCSRNKNSVFDRKYSKYHENNDFNSQAKLIFTDEEGNEFFLFAGNFDDLNDWSVGRIDGGKAYQLGIGNNFGILTPWSIVRVAMSDQFFSEDDYDANKITTLYWAAMSTRIIDLLSIGRELISKSVSGDDFITDLNRLIESNLFSLLSEEQFTEYDGTLLTLRKLLYTSILKKGPYYYSQRDKIARYLNQPSIYDYVGLENLNKERRGSTDLNSLSRIKNGEPINTSKSECLLKQKEILFTGEVKRGKIPRYLETHDKFDQLNEHGITLTDIESADFVLHSFNPTILTKRTFNLPKSVDHDLSSCRIIFEGKILQEGLDYSLVSDGNYQMIRILNDSYLWHEVSISIGYKTNNEKKDNLNIGVKFSTESTRNFVKLLDELRERKEDAYKTLSSVLAGIYFTNGDITVNDIARTIRNQSNYSYDSTRSFDKSSDSFLDNMSSFTDGNIFQWQCDGASEFLNYCLSKIFADDPQVKLDRKAGLRVSNVHNHPSFNDEIEKSASFTLSAFNIHQWNQISLGQNSLLLDATPLSDPLFYKGAGQRIYLNEDSGSQIFDENEIEIMNRRNIERALTSIKSTIASMHKNQLNKPDYWFISMLPEFDPLRSVVSECLKFISKEISYPELLESIKGKCSDEIKMIEKEPDKWFNHPQYRKLKLNSISQKMIFLLSKVLVNSII